MTIHGDRRLVEISWGDIPEVAWRVVATGIHFDGEVEVAIVDPPIMIDRQGTAAHQALQGGRIIIIPQ